MKPFEPSKMCAVVRSVLASEPDAQHLLLSFHTADAVTRELGHYHPLAKMVRTQIESADRHDKRPTFTRAELEQVVEALSIWEEKPPEQSA